MSSRPEHRPRPPFDARAELANRARSLEPERYLAATLASEPARAALIALAAYQGDLARIVATATQPLLGEIRLQWWRDGLDVMAKGGRTGSPVADALGSAIAAYHLPIALLAAISEARAFDLYDDPMPDEAALDGYLSKTEAIPFEMALRVLGLAAGDAGVLGVRAGRIFGLTRLLVRLPEHLAAGRLPLPVALISGHGVSPEMLLSGVAVPAIRRMLAVFADDIGRDFATLRPQLRALSRGQRVALLPLAVVPAYLRALTRPHRDPLRDIVGLVPIARAWPIARAHALCRI